jgi:DNA-binding transcriptional LysR family regulator
MILPNLNHLKYFADSVELGSMSAAAQRNSVTHPAVSRAIQAMENQLGLKLLIHKKKSFEVTPVGFQIALKAKDLLTAADSFNSDNLTNAAAVAGTVTLGISRTLGLAYLEPILKILASQFPQVKLNVRFGTTSDIAEKLAQGTIDLGLTIGHQQMATLKQSLLKRGEYVLVNSIKKHKISSKDLLSEQFILTEPRTETEFFKKHFFRKFKSLPSVKYEVASWDMITHLVAGGMGMGLVPDIAIAAIGKKIVPVKTDWFQCPYEIYLNQSQAAQSNAAGRALGDIIKEVVKD